MADRTDRKPDIDISDPVSVLRAALERTLMLGAGPVDLAEADGAEALPDVTLFELVRFGAVDGGSLRELTVSMLAALSSAEMEVVLWIRGDGRRLRLFIGRLDRAGHPTERDLLRNALTGFLHGTHVKPLMKNGEDHRALMAALARRHHAVAVVGLPSERVETAAESRLDETLDALAQTSFDLVVVATPIGRDQLDRAENNLVYTIDRARALAGSTITETESTSFQEAYSESAQRAWSRSETTSLTSSDSEGESRSENRPGSAGAGAALGALLGGVAGFVAGGPPGAALGGQLGAAAGGALGGALDPPGQRSSQESTSVSQSTAASATESRQVTRGATEQRQLGATRQITLQSASTNAEILVRVADEHRERIQCGRGVGMWSTSVRITADEAATAEHVGHLLIGAMRGDRSHLGPLTLVRFARPTVAAERIASFSELRSRCAAHPLLPGGEQPDTWLTTQELAFYVRPPSSSVATLDVRLPVRFGRFLPPEIDGPRVELGALVADERDIGTLSLALSDLRRHVFVAGTTGSGKTTTVRSILRQLAAQRIPFLVLEPAKTEYRDLFDDLERGGANPLRIVVGRPTDPRDKQLKINPLRAPHGVPLGRHVEAVKTLILGSFELHEGLPQAMERLIFRAFERFDLMISTGEHQPTLAYPTLGTFVARRELGGTLVDKVIDELGYDDRVRDNYKAALRLRLESFQRGVKKEIFEGGEGGELDFEELLRRPTFVELSDLTEPDVRRFVMGSLVLRLYGEREAEARQAKARGEPASKALRHLLVLEEAHHFLREVRGTGSAAQLAQHSTQLLADAFAELRTYGQGILVADQAPAELSAAVLRNTATKIIHTLFHEADCDAVGNAMGIEDEQRRELRRLRPGEAIVHSPGISTPVLCRVYEDAS